MQKPLAIPVKLMYSICCCDMIAKKREVAARKRQVFRGANVKKLKRCQLEETDDKSLYKLKCLPKSRNDV